MKSIFIGILVAVLAWVFMRLMRALALRRRQVRAPAPAPEDAPRSMPRIGTQGTVTKDQLRRLKAYHFEPSRMWSREEADLILDAVVYMRAAVLQVTGIVEAPEAIQNRTLAFVLSDDKLREYVRSWGRNRREKGLGDAPGSLTRNEHFERLATFITSISRESATQERT